MYYFEICSSIIVFLCSYFSFDISVDLSFACEAVSGLLRDTALVISYETLFPFI